MTLMTVLNKYGIETTY